MQNKNDTMADLKASFPGLNMQMHADNKGWSVKAQGPVNKVTVLLPGFPTTEQFMCIAKLVCVPSFGTLISE